MDTPDPELRQGRELRHRGALARLSPGARSTLRRARATSAGGIVVRDLGPGPEIVLGGRRRDRDGLAWTLPKGTPIPGESTEQTAVREVEEETGLEVGIVAPVGDIDYWFVQDGARIHKTVHYFLMEARGGDIARHDHEFDHVRWFPLAEAERIMTHATERAIVARAMAGAAATPAAVTASVTTSAEPG